jgi:hypothetical protein
MKVNTDHWSRYWYKVGQYWQNTQVNIDILMKINTNKMYINITRQLFLYKPRLLVPLSLLNYPRSIRYANINR